MDSHEPLDPAYEVRLRKRLSLLRDEMTAGRIFFPPEIAKALAEVRTLADGQIDLSTVDARVRALALAAEHSVYKRETREVSLTWVQNEYYACLEHIFDGLLPPKHAGRASPEEFAQYVRSKPTLVSAVLKSFQTIGDAMRDFWQEAGDVVELHLEEFKGLKAVFGGDVFPQPSANSVERAALYADCVVLPDPIHRIASELGSVLSDEEAAYQLVKHGLMALRLKPLVFAETAFPIVVVAPAANMSDNPDEEFISKSSEADALIHVNSALGSSFDNVPSLMKFLREIDDPDELEAKAVEPARLLSGWPEEATLRRRYELMVKHYSRVVRNNTRPTALADMIFGDAIGRMIQANILLVRSQRVRGMPLTDVPTSQRHIQWKYEYDATRSQSQNALSIDQEVVAKLVRSSRMPADHLQGVTVEGVLGMREAGQLENVRKIIRDDIGNSDLGTQESLDRAIENVQNAIAGQSSAIAQLRSERGDWFRSVAEWGVGASVTIGGAISGNYSLSLLAAGASAYGLTPIRTLWAQGKSLVAKGEALQRTPWGFFIS